MQVPALVQLPLQHEVSEPPQAPPGPMQFAHVPAAVQLWLQQSWLAPHVEPTPMQAWHDPPVHTPVQHCRELLQVPPIGAHACEPPVAHVAGPPSTRMTQLPLQQSPEPPHGLPEVAHCDVHVPPLQLP